jgi:hypothetical protein
MIDSILRNRFLLDFIRNYYFYNVPLIFLIQIILIVGLLFFARKRVFILLGEIPKSAYIALAAVLILQLIVVLAFNKPFMSDMDAYEYLESARFLINGQMIKFYSSFQHGHTWAVFLAFLFKIFGESYKVADWFNIFCSIGSSVGVFFLSWILFRKKTVSVFSALFFAFYRDTIIYSAVFKGEAAVCCFFAVWFLFFCVISFETDDWKLYGVSVLILAFLINIRQEMGIYIPVFFAGFFLLRKNPAKLKTTFILPAVLFLIFGFGYYYNFSTGFYAFYSGNEQSMAFISNAEKAKSLLQNHFSFLPINRLTMRFAFFLKNSGWQFMYWFGALRILFLLSFAGVLLKERTSRQYAFLFLTFVLANAAYWLHGDLPVGRFFMHAFPAFSILMVFGFTSLFENLSAKLKPKLILSLFFIAISLLQIAEAKSVFNGLNYRLLKELSAQNVMEASKNIKRLYKYNAFSVIVPTRGPDSEWRFNTPYTMRTLTDLFFGMETPWKESKKSYEKEIIPFYKWGDQRYVLVAYDFQDYHKYMNDKALSQCKTEVLFKQSDTYVYSLSDCKGMKRPGETR